MKFALIGAAGFVAPRHMNAIKELDGDLVAALDPNDSVGILDSYFPNCRFFTEVERFDRYLGKLYYNDTPIDFLSVCSPNYLHDAHCRLGLRAGADVICEKPLVIKPWNLDQLEDVEAKYEKNIYVILQLRLHPKMIELREKIDKNRLHRIVVNYITPRGNWYDYSWKGDINKSGGILMNIGIHIFDLLMWLFGRIEGYKLNINEPRRCEGILYLESAVVKWFLSINKEDLPDSNMKSKRSIIIDGEDIHLDEAFTDLHTEVYKDIVFNSGFGISSARQSIELIYSMYNGDKKW